MVTDLEQRRRAIADALRAIMAEPLPPRQPVGDLIEPVAVATQAVAAAGVDDDWDIDELAEPDYPTVPPMESAGNMSRIASLALFGHP